MTLRRTFHQVGPRFSNFAMPIELGGHHPYRNIFSGNRRRRLVQSDRRLVSPCPSWHVSEGEHFVSKTKAIGRFGGEVTLEAAKSTCCANPKCAAFMYGRNGTGGVYMAGPLYPTLTRGHDRQSGWELRRRKGHDGYTKPAFVPKKTLQFGRYAKAHAWWTDRGCSEEASGQNLWDREADAKGGVLTLLAPDARAFQCWILAELGAVKTEWSSITVDAASVADAQAVNTAHASQQASARKEEEEAELRGVAVEALAPASKEVERAAAPPPRSLIRGAEAWSAMRHRAITCEASNIVPTRGDDFAINIQDHRPWSAQATSFPLRPPAEDTSAQRECATGSELVNAYKIGRRRWTSRKGKTLVEAYDAQCGVASDMGRSRRAQLAACWALLRDGPVEPLGAKNASMYTQEVAYMEKYLAMQGMASAKQEARWSALGCDAMLAPCFALEDQLNSELSTFETSGCAVPFISGAALCELLGKFRSIDFIGDSLTRHLIQGLDILTSEDLVMGSSQMSFGDKQCVCDGAFSEAAVCREQTDVLNHKTQTAAYLWKPKGCPTAPVRYVTAPVLITASISNDEALSLGILVTRTRPHAHQTSRSPVVLLPSLFVALCTRLRFWHTRFQAQVSGFVNEAVGMTCNTTAGATQWDQRPAVIIAGGGFHAWSNTEIFAPQFKKGVPALAQCAVPAGQEARKGAMHLLTSFMTSQSRKMDEKWPYQSRERVAIENEKLRKVIADLGNPAGGSVHVLDFLNMTTNAQTSDGMHTLSEQNIAKAGAVVALLELIATAK